MISGTANLPVAPRNTPWNAKGAKQRIFEQCKGNVACLSRAFLHRNAGMDARDPDAWSLGFCDVIDGRLHIVPKGIAQAAGSRGLGTALVASTEVEPIQQRINTIYARVARVYPDWPAAAFALTADASGTPVEGIIAMEGVQTGDGRFIEEGALVWEDGPWPIVFDRSEMDHSGATVGTINVIERREDGVIWGSGNLSDSQDPETQMLVTRAEELFSEGAVGVSVSIDDIPVEDEVNEEGVWVVTHARIRSVAIVDAAAFSPAKMALAAAVRTVQPEWFADPRFGGDEDDRLVWQEPDRPEEDAQLGCPLTVTEQGQIYGHAALWGRCHVGYPGTCVRPPKEAAAYRGFLTGERIPGVPTGPLVMKTTHASLKANSEDAKAHYDNTGYAIADVTIGADAHGIWVAGAIRSDATQADIDILRGSALSGDWRNIGGQLKLVGLLVVNAPGFRVSRAMAASATLLTVGPGCELCAEGPSIEERLAAVEAALQHLSA